MSDRLDSGLADPSPPPPSPEEILIASLIVEYRLSTAEQLRLYELQGAMARNGIGPTNPAFPRWLSPVFCTSPGEQAQFMARFEELRAEIAPPPSSKPIWRRGAARGGAGRAPAGAAPPRPAPEVDEVQRRRRREALVLGLVCAGLLVALGLVMLLVGGGEVQLPWTAPPPPEPPSAREVTIEVELFNGWGLQVKIGWWALLGLIPLGIGLALSALLIVRLRQEQRAFRPTPEASRPIALRAALADYFGAQDVLRSILSLARHRLAPGLRLHIRRSLRATVRNAGYPTLRFGARPSIPGYLLLIDRETRRDHLPLVGEILARRLRQQYATVTRYAFNRRPKLLVNLDDSGERLASLSELASSLSGTQALVLAETDRLVRPTGQPVDWLDDLAAAGHVTVLDPRAESDWAGDEAALRRAGLAVLPATPDGIRRYAEWLAVGSGAPASARTQSARLDLPFQLSRHRALLLSAEPLDDDLMEGLLSDLEAWLSDDLMRLLRALAVFPRLEPPLTLALGKALKAAGGGPVLTDDNLLDIVRLPWLRAGHMPDQLRERLARKLSPPDLRVTVRMVHAFLVSETEALRHQISRPPRRPDLLVHWLRQSLDSDLHDPLLIDAVEGRAPEKLGTEPDVGLGVRLRRAARNPALVTTAVAIIAASIVMWLQPLSEKRNVPTGKFLPSVSGTKPPSSGQSKGPSPGGEEGPTAPAKGEATSPGPSRPSPIASAIRESRRAELAQAKREGDAALQRLFQLQESEGVVYENALEQLRDAIATGDLATIRRVDAATLSQIQFYEKEVRDRQQILPIGNRTFTLFFAAGKYKLTPDARFAMAEATRMIRELDVVRIEVIGYYDKFARPAETAQVAERRAAAVASALRAAGAPSDILVQGADTSQRGMVPSPDGVDEPVHRRVEINIRYREPQATAN